MSLVDSHCHLDFPDFADERDEVVARARKAGVGVMQTICTRLSRFDEVLALARSYDDVYCSVGVHPHNVADETVDAAMLIERAADAKVIGIGETGLDYYYEHSPRDRQRESFRVHIEAARATGLPLIVHTRDADADTMEILEDEMGKGAFPGLIHCFSTGRELAERAIAIGFYISLSGIVTFRRAEALRETAAALPLARLLVETDAPYLAPVPKRGKRNEPAFVAHVADCLAEIRGLPVAEVIEATSANFFGLFLKARPDKAECA